MNWTVPEQAPAKSASGTTLCYALSLGLNLLYDFNHEKIKQAFEAVVEGATKRGIPVLAAVNPCTVEQSRMLAKMGVRMQHFSTDLTIISNAFRSLMDDVVSKVMEPND